MKMNSKNVLISQQTCTVRENRHKLEKLLAIAESRKSFVEKKCLNGLISVFDLLSVDVVGIDGKEHTGCYLQFNDALKAFFDHFDDIKAPYVNTVKNKKGFMLFCIHNGTYVFMLYKRFIVLRPDEFAMEIFLDTICSKTNSQFASRMALDPVFIHLSTCYLEGGINLHM